MKFHPAAEVFPMLDDVRLAELTESIKQNGVRHPIVICEGMVLDGRNRYVACTRLGITPPTETFSGDPWAYAWDANGQRRDLKTDQRYLIWKETTEKSQEWRAAREEAQRQANERRAEAARAQHEASNPRAGEQKPKPSTPPSFVPPTSFGVPTTCGNTRPPEAPPKIEPKISKYETATATAKAEASKTNRGTVERMDSLAKARPELAAKVMKGEISGAEALRIKKKDEVKAVAPIAGKYKVVYADPAWRYGDQRHELETATGAEHHYPTMTLSEICAIPIIDHVEDNAVLFIWATSPLLEQCFEVIRSWGFKYKASFVWDKVKHNLGHYNSVRHEFLLVCTRGSCLPDNDLPEGEKLHDSVIEIERTAKHSQKPAYFRELIDRLYCRGNRIELFCREPAPGWASWGNEA
jgi:N6-adenosine-specific RNA methylase IME4